MSQYIKPENYDTAIRLGEVAAKLLSVNESAAHRTGNLFLSTASQLISPAISVTPTDEQIQEFLRQRGHCANLKILTAYPEGDIRNGTIWAAGFNLSYCDDGSILLHEDNRPEDEGVSVRVDDLTAALSQLYTAAKASERLLEEPALIETLRAEVAPGNTHPPALEKLLAANPLGYAMSLASRLDWIGTRLDLTPEQRAFAVEHGLVVVYGASDDLMEFDGAITNELGAFCGTVALVDANGLIIDGREEPAGKHHTITAHWGEDPTGAGATWSYSTEIPHATFRMVDGEELFCRGIVFSLEDLKPQSASDDELDNFLNALGPDTGTAYAQNVADRAPEVRESADDNDCGDACKI